MTTHPSQKAMPSTLQLWLSAGKIVGLGLAIAALFRLLVAQVCTIPSDSMTPILEVGDQVIVEKLSYDLHPPQRGDIVVFHAPPALVAQNLNEDLIKRIIGVPGDRVWMRSGKLWVNGQPVREPYVQVPAEYSAGPLTVPPNQYFVLGDNRNHSYDSHFWGFVPQNALVGHAVWRIAPLQRIGWL